MLPPLPAPQRHALAVALLLEESEEQPGEEVCFYVFESDRPDLAGDAGLWATLGFDRVQSVVAIDEP